MFTHKIRLFRVFGFQVNADLSWFLVVLLVAWWLATLVFPQEGFAPGLAESTYWLMGAAGSLLLFSSLLLHELGHALMARRFDLPIRGITLFIFGGVAEMTDEPPDPRTEFLVAIAGPVVSVLLTLGFLGLHGFGVAVGLPAEVNAVSLIVGVLNFFLVAFNAIPAFPLDGGRVLRSVLWKWRDDLRWATKITAGMGNLLGLVMIGAGVAIAITTGDLLGGLWTGLIGLFVRNAARMSYQQLLLRRSLEGEPVSRFMEPSPVTVPRALPVRELVDRFVYRHHFKTFPVVDDERLVGLVSTRAVRELPREEWDRQTVGTIVEPVSEDNTVAPDMDAMEALSLMSRTGSSRLLVSEGGRLVGILALKDLLKFFSLKMELEDAD